MTEQAEADVGNEADRLGRTLHDALIEEARSEYGTPPPFWAWEELQDADRAVVIRAAAHVAAAVREADAETRAAWEAENDDLRVHAAVSDWAADEWAGRARAYERVSAIAQRLCDEVIGTQAGDDGITLVDSVNVADLRSALASLHPAANGEESAHV